ncbi:TraR/DksA C4-type zinc finger protein [Desulfopila aestuarii]|uniref:Transcriptional regulator, TraR/DksA family n=1 Tax=Desulfopila aestuarii DSM 18488 TaxID=1121416 RepID=A0A1M7YIT3_9BACT|nr:TraR/DksA C4-type zinc finger protein [Desulfopila aestuarii]SHO52509.1 transcriptional regulator, TraR/DksA family [Desulfopila aestuarii DSM 18488]
MILRTIEQYRPTEDEEYMNSNQLEYFRVHLMMWRSELIASSRNFIQTLKEVDIRKPDPIDQSSANTEMTVDFQTRNHQNRLLRQIDYSLSRIAEGEYGYCEITGEEIGLRRLLARPVATMCVEVQERYERLPHRSMQDLYV